MSLKSSTQGGVQIVTVESDRIDAAMAIRFKDDMRGETESGPERVILDLSAVDFVGSSGLDAIVAAMKQLGLGGGLTSRASHRPLNKVFRLARMDSVFQFYPTLDHALDVAPS